MARCKLVSEAITASALAGEDQKTAAVCLISLTDDFLKEKVLFVLVLIVYRDLLQIKITTRSSMAALTAQ